jgi:PAS domain-containing protein
MTTSVIRDARGQPTAMLGIVRDITEARRAEAELANSHARFRRILESAPIPFCYVDASGAITFRNERFVRLFGYTEADAPTLAAWTARAYPDPAYRAWVEQHWKASVDFAREHQTEIEPPELATSAS